MESRNVILLICIALLAMGAACGSSAQSPAPSPTVIAASPTVAPPTARPTQMPASPSLTFAPPSPTPIRIHPANSRTGIKTVDNVIAAALANNPAIMRQLVRYTVTDCTKAAGLGGPPKCEPGEAEGTLVEVLPFLGAEGSFTRRPSIDNAFKFKVRGLYGVYRVPANAYKESYWPAGDYGIVLIRDDGLALTLLVSDGWIVRIVYHMAPLEMALKQDVGEWLLPPWPLPSATATRPAAQSQPTRIRFQPGSTSETIRGTVAANGIDRYVLNALSGQMMTVEVKSSQVNMLLTLSGADGQVLKSQGVGPARWSGILPTSQDYFIAISTETGAAASYTLQATILPLATLPPKTYLDPKTGIAFDYPGGWYLQVAPRDLPVDIFLTSYDPANPPHKLQVTSDTASLGLRYVPSSEAPNDLSAWVQQAKQKLAGSGLSIFSEERLTLSNRVPAAHLGLVSGSGGIIDNVYVILKGHHLEFSAQGNFALAKSVLNTVRITPVIITPVALPDLIVSHMYLEMEGRHAACVSAYTPYGIRVVIQNRGSGNASSHLVELNGTRQVVGDGLAAGQSIELHFAGTTSSGQYVATVDVTHQVEESDETNNTRSFQAPTPTPPPLCTPTRAPSIINPTLMPTSKP